MGKTFAHLSWLGNVPEFMLLFMSAATIGDNILDANFIILDQAHLAPWLSTDLRQKYMKQLDHMLYMAI